MGLSIKTLSRLTGKGRVVTYPIDRVGGTPPLFAYGIAKLTISYNGPAVRVIRMSDNAEMDIGFIGNKLDIVTLNTFLSGSAGEILKFYDQSGNGNDTQVQTNSISRFTFYNDIYALKAGDHYAVYGSAVKYDLPTSLSVNIQNVSVYSVVNADVGLGAIINFGSGASQLQQFFQNGIIYNTTIPVRDNITVVELHTSSSNRIDGYGTESVSRAAPANIIATEGMLGYTVTPNYEGSYHGAAWICYNRSLSDIERTIIKTSLNSMFNLNVEPTRIVYVGDSITAGTSNNTRRLTYGLQSLVKLKKKVIGHNKGGGGQKISSFLASFATLFTPILTNYPGKCIFFLMMGTNDLTIDGKTAEQIYADIQSFCGNVRAANGKIIVATILPNNAWTATQKTTRETLNDLIRNNWATFADGFADFGLDPTMGVQSSAADTSLYTDGLHPSVLGQSYLAQVAVKEINKLI